MTWRSIGQAVLVAALVSGTSIYAQAPQTLLNIIGLQLSSVAISNCLQTDSNHMVVGSGAGCGGGGGSGTVTNTAGALTLNAIAFGNSGNDLKVGNLAGDVTTAGGFTTTIAAAAVTLAKIQNAAANSKILCSGASGSGASYSECTLGTNLSMSGTTINAAGGSGSPGGSNLDVQCNISGAFGACETGVFKHTASTHTTSTTTMNATGAFSDGTNYTLWWTTTAGDRVRFETTAKSDTGVNVSFPGNVYFGDNANGGGNSHTLTITSSNGVVDLGSDYELSVLGFRTANVIQVMRSAGLEGWSSTSSATGTPDACFGRNAANLIEADTCTAGTFADIRMRAAQLNPVAFASLPGSPVKGQVAYITDSNSTTFHATAAGGGSNNVMVAYDGANWKVGG